MIDKVDFFCMETYLMLVWVGKKYLDPTQSPPSGRNGPIWPKMGLKKRPNLTMLDFFALFVVQCPFQWPCLTKTISTEPESPLRPNFITALWPWGPNFGQKFGPIRLKNEYAWIICIKWCTIAILMTMYDKTRFWAELGHSAVMKFDLGVILGHH